MIDGVLTENSEVRAMLADLCARNVPAEIHYGPGDDVQTARVRMLALDEDVVCTDEPQGNGSRVALRTGDAVRVFLLKEGMRYGFDSRVHALRRRVRLNAQRQVTGMALRIPASIKSEQRRRDYRVSLLGYDLACTACPESTRHPGACELSARRMTTTIANISARGAGLVFPEKTADLPRTGELFFLEFSLPEEEGIFIVNAEARHTKPVPGHESIIVGMRILRNDLLGEFGTSNRLARFVVSEQRRMLRRRK